MKQRCNQNFNPRGFHKTLQMTAWKLVCQQLAGHGVLNSLNFSNKEFHEELCHYMCACAQLCLSVCDPIDNLPSVHGIFQQEYLWEYDWVASFHSSRPSWPRYQTCVFFIAGWVFTTEPPEKPVTTYSNCIKSLWPKAKWPKVSWNLSDSIPPG